MKTANALKKLAQFGKVKKENNRRYSAINGDYVISFIDQDGEIICIKSHHINDRDDIMTDYFAGSYFDNLSQAIRYATR